MHGVAWQQKNNKKNNIVPKYLRLLLNTVYQNLTFKFFLHWNPGPNPVPAFPRHKMSLKKDMTGRNLVGCT